MADRLSAEGGGQQELADEIRELAGRLPKAGSGLASVGGTGDPNDGADVISPFGIGEGGVRVENLDDAGFVTRSPLGVLGGSLIDGGRPWNTCSAKSRSDDHFPTRALASSPRPRPAPDGASSTANSRKAAHRCAASGYRSHCLAHVGPLGGCMAAAMKRVGTLYHELSLSVGTPLSCHHTLVLRACQFTRRCGREFQWLRAEGCP